MVAAGTSIITGSLPSLPPPETTTWENYDDDDEDDENKYLIPKPSEWFLKLVSLQADIIYHCLATLTAPIWSLMSVASESYRQAEEAKQTFESVVHKVPSTLTRGTAVLLKKLGYGILVAAYLSIVLVMLLILSVLLGIALVNFWVEEPVFVRERLHFDYTEPNPTAVFAFHHPQGSYKRKPIAGVPAGHTFYVSLELLMPESDFNRDIGVFQVTAELVSDNGDVIDKSSQPCMLRFRSLPVRLTRTFIMGVPLLLGISGETQKLKVQILKHKEGRYPRTRAIRVTLHPRAGTSYLPQLYEAEIVMNSKLPWTKQLLHNWKWTLYIWSSLYVYVMLLILLFVCCKPLFFPMTMITTSTTVSTNVGEPSYTVRESAVSELSRPRGSQSRYRDVESEDVPELLRKWQRSRSKRKAIYLQADLNLPSVETIGSPAPSTICITREDASMVAEDVGDSESVCYKAD